MKLFLFALANGDHLITWAASADEAEALLRRQDKLRSPIIARYQLQAKEI